MLDKFINDFEKAVKNLEAVMNLEFSEFNRDSAIKRFEICFDLAWKAVKIFAKLQGIECYSPRQCFKEAFSLKLIDYDNEWLKIIEDRNLCAHIYSESYVEKVYPRLRNYLLVFKKLLDNLKKLKG
jgi:nucleotidyltransferase substrate binding protein (TIGR01987 family)